MDPGSETVKWLKFQLDVQMNSITVNKRPYQGASRVGQLSESGIGIMIPANLKIHDRAVLEFTLPGSNQPLKVQAVLRERSNPSFRYWFDFVDLADDQRKQINVALAGSKPGPKK